MRESEDVSDAGANSIRREARTDGGDSHDTPIQARHVHLDHAVYVVDKVLALVLMQRVVVSPVVLHVLKLGDEPPSACLHSPSSPLCFIQRMGYRQYASTRPGGCW